MTVTRTTATSRRAFLRSAGAFPPLVAARTAGADDEALSAWCAANSRSTTTGRR